MTWANLQSTHIVCRLLGGLVTVGVSAAFLAVSTQAMGSELSPPHQEGTCVILWRRRVLVRPTSNARHRKARGAQTENVRNIRLWLLAVPQWCHSGGTIMPLLALSHRGFQGSSEWRFGLRRSTVFRSAAFGLGASSTFRQGAVQICSSRDN